MVPPQPVEFGLGLIGIGKPWGFANAEVPPERQARELLERAFALGIRYFDTAPSYGISDQRLASFLRSLPGADRATLRIATKFGEHWNAAASEPFVDHSYDALARSLDGSFQRLGRIDILQLHKTTPAVLRSDDLARAWEYARGCGIGALGASVSDLESAEIAIADPALTVLQFPYNVAQQTFEPVLEKAASRGMHIAINRPFGMGKLLYESCPVSKPDAFAYILRKPFRGAILSGTKSPAHLEENYAAFRAAHS